MIRRAAVIVIGSNSTRMLCANLDPGLTEATREREETKLYLGLDEVGMLSQEVMQRTAEAVCLLKEKALAAGAESINLLATATVREAQNARDLIKMIHEGCRLELHVIDGKEEARLSFVGACVVDRLPMPALMADIGGGSAEFALGMGEKLLNTFSLPLGGSRLYRMQPINSEADIPKALEIAENEFEQLGISGGILAQGPGHLVLVGGTGTVLMDVLSARGLAGPVYAPEDISHLLHELARLTPEERATIPYLPESRIHIFPTGLVVLEAIMENFGLSAIRVSKRTNMDGYLYELATRQQ